MSLRREPAVDAGARLRRVFFMGAIGVLLTALLAACWSAPQVTVSSATPSIGLPSHRPPSSRTSLTGIRKIKHVIIIMQENRSFDSYFGTYPGADGIPMRNGRPTVCVPKPAGGCLRPYHDTADVNGGGPHGVANAVADVDGGKMDGFISERYAAAISCPYPDAPECSLGKAADVMGYHTGAEIPNYWAYAKNFVLADHMFEPVKSWSLPDHLYLVSDWSARCASASPRSCVNNIAGPDKGTAIGQAVDQELTVGSTSIDLA